MQTNQNFNKTIKAIFEEPNLVKVLCSIYDKEVSKKEMISFLDIEFNDLEKCITKLTANGLLKHRSKDGAKFYSLANEKICDAIINLKDELNKI